MELFILLLVVMCNAYIVFNLLRRYKYIVWAIPISFSLVMWFFNYSIRALQTYFFEPYFYTDEHTPLLIYYLVFVILTYLSFVYFAISDNLSYSATKVISLLSGVSNRFFMAMFLIVIGGFVLKFYAGTYYGFSTAASDNRNILENVILNLGTLQWLVFFLALHFAINKSSSYYFYVLMLAGCIVYESMVSTSKAPVFTMLYDYLLCMSLNNQRIGRFAVLAAVILGLALSFYSYVARFTGTAVQDRVGASVVVDTIDKMTSLDSLLEERVKDNMVKRLELLDNLTVLSKRYDIIERGAYEFGSLVELITIIPHTIWPDRPDYNFNEFVQYELMGLRMKGTTMGIGRIGEAFLVFWYFGCFMAIIYSLAYEKLYKLLVCNATDPLHILVYIQLYFCYFMRDDYLVQNIFTIIFSLFSLIVIYRLNNKKMRPLPGLIDL